MLITRRPAKCIFRRNPLKNALLIAGLAAALSAAGGPALAQSGTWTLNNAGNWSSGGNWSGGVIPGSTTATNSTDTAWFSANLTAARTVTVDANRNIRNITFDGSNSGTFGYTLSGGSLLLTSGGTISATGSLGAHTDTISAPMTILGNNATYTISNDSTLATRLLSISGRITGQSTTGGTTTLILGGNNSGTSRFSGALDSGTNGGTIALVKEGTGTWSFAGSTRFSSGPITINGGSLLLQTQNNVGQGLGQAPAVTLANVAGAQLDFGASNHNALNGIGSLSGGGANGGNIVNAGYANSGIFIGFDNTSTTYGGRFISGQAAGGITKVGTGTLTLTGSGNDAGGTTNIRGGAIGLDFSQATTGTDILASTRAVSLQGGRLLLTGSNAATNSQTFASTTVAQGSSGIALTSNGASGLLASLGAITRNAGGTLDITLPTGSQSTTNGVRTTTTNVNNSVLASANGANGIAYATVSGTTWAGLSSGNIVALSSYTTGTASYTATNNVDVTNGDTISTGTVNTLRFNGSNTLNLTGTTTIGASGVLVTSAASAGAAFSGGTLRPGGGNELVLINNGSLLTVGSVISNNGSTAAAVTLSGTGNFRLNGNNTYTGATTISSGTVTLGSATALGASGSSAVWIADNPNAALDLNGNNISIGSLAGAGGVPANFQHVNSFATNGGLVAIGTNSFSAGSNNTNTSYGGRISGSGRFAKLGTGRLILTGTNPFSDFTGVVAIESGTLTAGTMFSQTYDVNPFGAVSTIELGRTGGGSSNATLAFQGTTTTPIVLAASNTGTMTIQTVNQQSIPANYAGTVSGTGSLRFNLDNTDMPLTVSGTVNHVGTVLFTTPAPAAGNYRTRFTGVIGSNVTDVTIQNSVSDAAGNQTFSGVFGNTGQILLSGSAPATNVVATNISGNITSASRLTMNILGSGTAILSGTNTFSGDVLVQSGQLRLDNAQAIQNTSGVSISGPGILNINASGGAITQNIANSGQIISGLTSGTATISGAISGTGSVSTSGAGTMILSGSNSYTGLTTLGGGGVLSIDSANALAGGSNLTFTSGTLRYGAGVTTDLAARIKNSSGAVGINTGSNAAVTFAAAIDNTNSGGLTKSGTGTLFLSAVNTYTGTTTVTAGTLAVTGAGSIVSTGAVNVNGSGATFDISGVAASGLTIGSLSGTSSSFVTLGGKTLTVGDATSTTYSGTIGGTGGLTKVGAGSLTLSGINTFSGDTLISSGTLVTGHWQALQFSGLDTSGAGVIDANPGRGALWFGGLIGSKNLANVVTANTSSVGRIVLTSQAGKNYNYSGNIADFQAGMILEKSGPGTQILSGSNSYTGATQIAGGVLRLDSANAIPGGIGATGGSSALTISGGVVGLGFGDFTRATGTSTNQVQFGTGGGGFAAYGADRTVNLGNVSGTASWNGGNFVPSGSPLILGAADATHMVTFQNPIALGSAVRTVQVDNGSADVDATLTGVLSGAGGGLTKTGLGTLELPVANTHTGTTTVSAGTLRITNNLALQNSPLNTSGGGAVALTVTTPTFGGLAGSTDLASLITSGYGSITALTLNPGSGATASYSGAIADGAAGMTVTKTGSGSQIIGGANTYTGNTTISTGTLQLGVGSSLPGNIANAANLVFLQGGASTGVASGVVSGTGTVTMSGGGVVRLSNAANTYTGKTTIANGTLEIGSIGNVSGGNTALGAPTTSANGTIDLGSGTSTGTLRYTGTGQTSNRLFTLAGTTGGGGIESNGTGPLVLTGTVSTSGVGSKVFTLGGSSTGTNSIGPIDGSNVSVTKTGPTIWRLTGNSGYTGQLKVLDGTIVVAGTVGSSGASPVGANTTDLPIIGDSAATSGTAGFLAEGVTVARGLSVAAASGSSGSQVAVLGGVGTGTTAFLNGASIKLGRSVTLQASTGGRVEFWGQWQDLASGTNPAVAFTVGSSGNAGTVAFNSDLPNLATALNVANGTAQLMNNNERIYPTTPVTVGSTLGAATLDLNGFSQSLSRLTFAGNSGSVTTGTAAGGMLRLVNSGSVAVSGTGHVISSPLDLVATTTFDTDSASVLTVSSVISSTSGMGLTKTGLGTLTLSASNTYTGATLVTAGQLRVNGSLASAVTVQAAATLGGSGRLAGNLTGDGLIAPGNSPGILTVDGQITPTGTTAFAFELSGTAPTWSSASASVNDVLRLTNEDPFASGLTSTNIVNIYFDVASLTNGDTFLGGFFSDRTSGQLGFLAEIGLPTYQFFVLGSGSGTATTYNGKSYYTLAQYNPSLTGATVSVVTVPMANYASGDVTNGQVTQFVIIPEPSSLALAALGIAAAAWAARRRM